MARKPRTWLTSESVNTFNVVLNKIDTLVICAEGVIIESEKPVETAADFIRIMNERVKLFVLYNNSMVSRKKLSSMLHKCGMKIPEERLITLSYITVQYLKEKRITNTVYVIGNTDLQEELCDAGIEALPVGRDLFKEKQIELDRSVGAVVVGCDYHLSYAKLIKASNYLIDPNVYFVVTAKEETFPPKKKLKLPSAGALAKAIEISSQRTPTYITDSYLPDYLKKHYGIKPEGTLLVGSKFDSDILLGIGCDFTTVLITKNCEQEAKALVTAEVAPNFFANNLIDLEKYILK